MFQRLSLQAGQTREMASQLLAAKMIPHLGVPGLAAAPPGKLPSHHDFLRLLWHHEHYQMKGFNGIPSICCTIDSKTKAFISSLTTQTVNLAPSDWQKRILADNLTSAAQHSAKIAIMTDYLGPEGTRYSKTNMLHSALELMTLFKDLLLWHLRA